MGGGRAGFTGFCVRSQVTVGSIGFYLFLCLDFVISVLS